MPIVAIVVVIVVVVAFATKAKVNQTSTTHLVSYNNNYSRKATTTTKADRSWLDRLQLYLEPLNCSIYRKFHLQLKKL